MIILRVARNYKLGFMSNMLMKGLPIAMIPARMENTRPLLLLNPNQLQHPIQRNRQ